MPSPRTFHPLAALLIVGVVALATLSPLLLPGIGTAQEPAVKPTPIILSDATSGKQMYADYCASCHGKDAKGDGPAAVALRTAPANLTQLAKNNAGKYPAAHVSAILTFGDQKTAHGSKNMPVWGRLFQSLNWSSSTKEIEAKQRINLLNQYLESLQAK